MCRSLRMRHNIVKELIFKRRKEMHMQESMEDAIAAEPEFRRCNSESHSLLN